MSHPLLRVIDHQELRVDLIRYGSQLWTRQRAREIRVEVTRKLEQLAVGGALVFDAAGVDVFDYSFANELFGKTLLSAPIDYPSRFVIVENLNEYTRENLARALETLGLVIIERQGREIQLLGKYHPADYETLRAIWSDHTPVTANELKEKLGLNLTTVSERLTKLCRLGVLRRDKSVSSAGREQYQYSTFE